MKKEFVRNPYNYDSDELSNETGLACKDESLTEQEHLEETDINYIAEKFMRTGMAPQVLNMPTFGDFEGIFDFQSAMNIINAAKAEFMSLPAKIRTRFNNDPNELIAFIEDPDNRDEARRLGFIQQPEPDDELDVPASLRKEKRETTEKPESKEEKPTGPKGTPGKGAKTDET